jgi:hypothetical protein
MDRPPRYERDSEGSTPSSPTILAASFNAQDADFLNLK